MRNISTKLLISIGMATIFFAIFFLYQTYSLTNNRVREVVEKQASMALKFDLAIRKYIAENVRPVMSELLGPEEFMPETMSTSYVARTIFEDVRKEFPNYIIKFASDNPRNPVNQAGPEELKIIEYFNNNPHVKRWEGEISIDGEQYVAKFSPMRMEESCLRCHSDPKYAPASLLKRYGSTAGFHRPLGQVIGMDTIAIPMAKIAEQLWSTSMQTFLVGGLGLLLFFLTIIFTTRFIITNRLTMISNHFVKAAQQKDYSKINPIEIKGRDEIFDLAFSFNTLSGKLKDFYSSLEVQVKERTRELEDTTVRLKQEIGERTRYENSLGQSEARYKALFDNMNNGIAVYKAENDGEDFTFIDFNKAGERIDNITKDKLIDKSVLEAFPSVRDMGLFDVFQCVWRTGKSEQHPISMYEDERIIGWRENFVYKLPSGEIVAIYSDETERKQAEETLKKSEEKYRTLFEAESDAIFIVDEETADVLDANEAALQLYGYSRKEITALKAMDFSAEPEKTELAIRVPGKSFVPVRYHRKKDGTVFVVEIASNDFELNGRRTNVSAIRDITGRIRAEESLRESEEQLKAMMNHLPAGIVMIDADTHKIVSANPGALQLIGAPEEKVVGSVCHRYICPAKEGECPITDLGQTVDNSERILLKADGQKIPILKSVCKIMLKGKEYLLETFIDITDRKKLETQLQQSQRMESIGTLAGGIAHDFNNILFPIIGFAEMALDDMPAGSPVRENIIEILHGAKRAGDLVKQILAFSRQADQELRPLKVQFIIKEVLKLIRSSLPSTIEIKQYISNKCGFVLADATQIHQIAMNLMANAYHAMLDNGGRLEVTLKDVELEADDLKDFSMLPGAYVCLTVSDTGIGMEKIVMDRIFDPYFTTKEKDKSTGLGLSVVHGIVKSYKGEIRVYSEAGKGTTFHVYLPVIKSQVEAEEPVTITPDQRGTEHVLLVDDEVPTVRMEKQMLERLGYHVTSRSSSVDALEAFRAAPDKFDLVITDMTMPNMTGVQLSQKLLETRPDIPIIICTGFSENIDDEKAKAAGIRGYVMKPIVKSELAKKIREVLDQED